MTCQLPSHAPTGSNTYRSLTVGNAERLAHHRALNPGKHCPCDASAMLMADLGVYCGRYAAARAACHASAAAGGWLGTCLATHAGTRGRHGGQAFACACQPGSMQHEAGWRVCERSQLSHVACLARANTLAWKVCTGMRWHVQGHLVGKEMMKSRPWRLTSLQACPLAQAQGSARGAGTAGFVTTIEVPAAANKQ